MSGRSVRMSDLVRRRSWSPRDFIYSPGDIVEHASGEKLIVVEQRGDDLLVAAVEYVPGSRTPFCCTLREPVSLFDVRLRG